jgi:hypothetical protein
MAPKLLLLLNRSVTLETHKCREQSLASFPSDSKHHPTRRNAFAFVDGVVPSNDTHWSSILYVEKYVEFGQDGISKFQTNSLHPKFFVAIYTHGKVETMQGLFVGHHVAIHLKHSSLHTLRTMQQCQCKNSYMIDTPPPLFPHLDFNCVMCFGCAMRLSWALEGDSTYEG